MAQAAIIEKCDLCNTEEQVDYYCINCEEILCLTCKSSHSKSRKTRNDTIIPLSQARRDDLIQTSEPVFCSDHATVEVTLFCLKCDTLICTQCLGGKHKGHGVTTLDEIKDAKVEELKKVIETLQEKKSVYLTAFDVESQVHSQFSKSIDKVRNEIFHQKYKLIGELNVLCDEQNTELSKCQQNEDKRYADACNKIQVQSRTITSSLQAAQNIITNNNVAQIIQTTNDAIRNIHELEEPTLPCTKKATYKSGDKSRPAILKVQGEVNIQQGSRPERNVKTDQDKISVKIQQQKSDDYKHPQSQKFHSPTIDVSKVKIKSTLQVTGRDMGRIDVIIPLQNKTAWVAANGDKNMSLIDSKGEIISTSATFSRGIFDGKEYSQEFLVTVYELCKIFTMSRDGKMISTFSDLSPYKTRGLCITDDMNVMVCLQSTKDGNDNKVVRLGRSGDTIQSIHYSGTGVPLYKNPWRVTSFPTGEVIVIDWGFSKKLIGMKGKEPDIFTWDFEIRGRKINYSLRCITSDNNNIFVTQGLYDGVYAYRKDGSGFTPLLENKKEIRHPWGIALDSEGQLWVGCNGGKIYVIEY